jgi:predicted nuclease of predicted toxin-antitoxin system
VKLLVDLNVAPRTARFLREIGHDVIRVGASIAPESADADLVAFARAQSRVIVTHDLDFSALVALSRLHVPSVVTLRLSTGEIE